MKPLQTEAIVLRRTNYGEADRILQLLTPDHGKIGVLAKGVRREKSKLAGGIELLAITQVVVQRGKGELGILTGARLDTFFVHIMNEYDRLELAYAILKQIGAAAEMVPEPEWYFLAKQSLTTLNNLEIPLEVIELWYKLQHSQLLGHAFNSSTDIEGVALKEDATYNYDAHEMGLRQADNGPVTSQHIKIVRLAMQTGPEVIARIENSQQLVRTCLQIARLHDQA